MLCVTSAGYLEVIFPIQDANNIDLHNLRGQITSVIHARVIPVPVAMDCRHSVLDVDTQTTLREWCRCELTRPACVPEELSYLCLTSLHTPQGVCSAYWRHYRLTPAIYFTQDYYMYRPANANVTSSPATIMSISPEYILPEHLEQTQTEYA